MFALASLSALAQTPEHRVKYYDNGQKRYEGDFVNDQPVGELRRYHENGKLAVIQVFDQNGNSEVKAYCGDGSLLGEGRYEGKLRAGHWRYYSVKKALMREETYIKGKKEGVQYLYYDNGGLLEQCYYQADVLDSVRIQYYDNGNVMARFYYVNGLPEGEYRSYNYDGTPESEGSYKAGKPEGWWYLYDEAGTKDSLFYKDGVSAEREARILRESVESETDTHIKDPEKYLENPDAYFNW